MTTLDHGPFHWSVKAISCYYGVSRSSVYPAPVARSSFFFSNNLSLKRAIELQGWRYIYDPVALSEDALLSSLQSKKVKFLQFDLDKIGYEHGDHILYFDHKFRVTEDHVITIGDMCRKALLIRNTPKTKLLIQDEIDDAMPQDRYRKNMGPTRSWLSAKYAGGYSDSQRIMNTGLIYYRNLKAVWSLCESVYSACWRLGQPECQIIWALLSQKYMASIQQIDWNTLPIDWCEPDSLGK